ncbi:MAG: cytochrome oxidase subunit III [Bacteroidetes bacterium MED-G17]|jgi:cytochrome c oxidase subunit 3|nr:MAG: cytochrome oxidase subunit III [Bacteroidetes bacterium MED-G17]CAI8264687.1 MAG: Cytochrome c oxidase subunit 3 [Bacteroidetes bacterium MED-G17]|tara:strand:+ start:10497 stop:11066 length:570 start_codon:yes stop_codon:yes gene_type:complete
MNISKEASENVNPKKFSLWLFLIAIIMLFAGFTSAYIVRIKEGNWLEFELPEIFLYSSITILISSLTMIWAYRAAKNDEIKSVQFGLLATFFLGILFLSQQLMGFGELISRGLHFVQKGDKISASFFYVIAGVHWLHLLGGLLVLLVLLVRSLRSEIHKKNLLSINMLNTYWHFIGILWVYLYLFLYFA